MPRPAMMIPGGWSCGDLLRHLGGIPPERIRLYPAPGRALERHVAELDDHQDRLYELIDGVLVEKAGGIAESIVAMEVTGRLIDFNRKCRFGIVTGTSGPFRLAPRQVRIPDAAFTSWTRLPGGVVPSVAIPDLAPDLAVEVLSEDNTKGEMERKLKDYFFAGVRLVWYIDLKKRTAEVYTSPDQGITVTEVESLDGGAVLPGFRLPLRQLFALLAPPRGKKPNGRRKKPS